MDTGWPSYQGGDACVKSDNQTLQCGQVVKIDLETMEPTLGDGNPPGSFAYLDNGTFVYKKYDSSNGVGVALLPGKESALFMDETLTGSMFTRLFFYDGIGLEHFELFKHTTTFQNQNIYVYKVRYDS